MYDPQLDTFIRVAEAGSFSKAAQDAFSCQALFRHRGIVPHPPQTFTPLAKFLKKA